MAFGRGLFSIAVVLLSVVSSSAARDTGFLYGTVTLEDDSEVTGSLRWDGEEVAWIQHFNGSKVDTYDISLLSNDDQKAIIDRQPGPQLNLNGHVVEFVKMFGGGERKPQDFAIEFGNLAELQLEGRDRVTMVLRDGTKLRADGGSNDISDNADIEIQLDEGTNRDLDWKDIKTIRFHAPDSDPARFPQHLYGVVESELGSFAGFVAWDQDERFPSEKLDSEMGGVEEEIEFASIRRIAREGTGSRVTLADGVEKFLTGTNDVDPDNRGLVINDPDIGRVVLDWELFNAVEFQPAPDSLPTFADFASMGPLKGRVVTEKSQHEGELVFDIDQWLTAESIHGRNEGVEYWLPFRLIARIEPMDQNGSRITMKNNRKFELRAFDDVTQSNDGVIVKKAGADPVYVPWADVKSIEISN